VDRPPACEESESAEKTSGYARRGTITSFLVAHFHSSRWPKDQVDGFGHKED
jgi:hypothetical protein